jgi:riboflavin transporter FmnP
MSTQSEAAGKTAPGVNRITLGRAVVAGVVGGIVFGIPLQFVIERMPAIGALYTGGDPSVAVGWVAHLIHSAIFGLVFGLLTEADAIARLMRDNVGIAGFVGLGYGVVLWSINIAFVWPVWLDAVGFPPAAEWSIPFLAPKPLMGHLIYGVTLGVVFYYLVDY